MFRGLLKKTLRTVGWKELQVNTDSDLLKHSISWYFK